MSEAKIIVFFNQKGGVGKTTNAVNTAYELTKKGRVLLIDIDPQGSTMAWISNAPDEAPFPAVVSNLSMIGRKLVPEIKKQIDLYDYIIIDSPPSKDQEGARAAMLIADLVVIPVDPAPLDFWASEMALDFINDARITNYDLIALFLRSKEDPNTNLAKVIKSNIDELVEEHEKTFHMKTSMSHLVSHREAPLYGTGVTDTPKANPKAVHEAKALVSEILGYLES
jgi:chromosome partitioning protein